MSHPWTRRRFLAAAGIGAGVGLGTTLLPFIPKSAAEDGFPRRVLLFSTGNGTIMNDWRPPGGETDYRLSTILEPLARHRDDIAILDGIDNDAGLSNDGVTVPRDPGLEGTHSHQAQAILFTCHNLVAGRYTGHQVSGGQGPSVDHVIAQAVGSETPRRLVHVGMGRAGRANGSADPRGRAHYRAANEPYELISSPSELFEHLFDGLETGSAASMEAAMRRRMQRQSVLDAVRGELGRVRDQLPVEERPLFEEHLGAIRDIETRLGASAAGTCALPDAPGGMFDAREPEDAQIPAYFDMQLDIVTAAMRCDLSRIFCLQFSGEGAPENMPWLPSWAGRTVGMHESGHQNTPEARVALRDAGTWLTEKFAELLDRLKAIPEGSGSLLDNTVVIWAMSNNEGSLHANRNVPVVVANGRTGPFRTGRCVRWGDYFRGPDGTLQSGGGSRKVYRGGKSMAHLWVTLCHVMGLPEMDRFGDMPPGDLDEELLA
jgi:hypothetical protein